MTTFASPAELRAAVRRGEFTGQTAGQCSGFVQTNVVILPTLYRREFFDFCLQNPRPCPVVAYVDGWSFDQQIIAPRPAIPCVNAAPGADLRTDVPRYRIFRSGVPDSQEPTAVRDVWREDLVGFLLGCSFTFEAGLIAAGLPVRHIDEGRNVPMYRTSRACATAGRFAGPLVVSMRPYRPEQVDAVVAVTSRFPTMHGAPVHVGDPAALGITNINRPDFGDAVTIRDDEVPVFWACGVTPQLALLQARPQLAITHSPGCMFVTDLRDDEFRAES